MDKKILIVDDNLDALDILNTIMDKEGYITYTASTGEECMKQLELHKPDLILLDVLLPDVLGTDLCMEIKSDTKYDETIIILISGIRISPDDHALGLEIGATDYIKRPYNKRELVARVNAILRLKETLVNKRENEPYQSFTNSSTDLTASVFEQQNLKQAYPEKFDDLKDQYLKLMGNLIEQRLYKTGKDITDDVKEMAKELGFIKATARDIIEIHKSTLKALVKDSSALRTYYVKEEGRILLVELMGYLLTFYRNLS